ncbi:Gt5 [Vibrio chagasii]|nr:Gt5 [Vibrio chagasii]CAH7427570.1 Gt5 [Vibrio chagasii]
MKVLYVHDFCFYKNDETIFTAVGLPEKYFDRFLLNGAKEVRVFSRNKIAEKNDIESAGFFSIKNKHIKLPIPVKNYFELLSPKVFYALNRLLRETDVIVINFPSIIGLYLCFLCKLYNRKYVLEVAADDDQFLNKKGGLFLTFIFRMVFCKFVRRAEGAIYVSDNLLKKYPNKNSEVASNVYIDKLNFRGGRRKKEEFDILFAGGVNKRKGVDILLGALHYLIKVEGVRVTLHIAGGHLDDDYECIVDEYGIRENVVFHGILERRVLEDLYYKCDLYVQPSRAEGIPRATIEAMSFGLPVVATQLPGFKEILSEDCLVPIGDSIKLANKIKIILNDDSIYKLYSDINLGSAEKFLISNLDKRRNSFFSQFLRLG